MSMFPEDENYVTFQYDPAGRIVSALKVADWSEEVFREQASSPEALERLAAAFQKFSEGYILIRFGTSLPFEVDNKIFDLGEYVREHRSLFPGYEGGGISELWESLQLGSDLGDVAEKDKVLYQIAEIYIRSMTLSDPNIREVHGIEELSDMVNTFLEPYHAFVELEAVKEDWLEDGDEKGNTWAYADYKEGFDSEDNKKWMEVMIMEFDASKKLIGFDAIEVGTDGGRINISENMRYCKVTINVE